METGGFLQVYSGENKMIKKYLIKIINYAEYKAHLFFDPLLKRRFISKSRKKLKNQAFTILSSTCAAGVIYNILGQKFDSPTINTWMFSSDFCKFVNNLEYYLSLPLQFYKKEGRECPCAMLDDIGVDFVHYKTKEEAEQKWNERKKRIHYDNLYLITSEGNGVTVDELNSIKDNGVNNVCIITNTQRPEIRHSVYCKSLKDEISGAYHMMVKKKWGGYQAFLGDFDFVGFINQKNIEIEKKKANTNE